MRRPCSVRPAPVRVVLCLVLIAAIGPVLGASRSGAAEGDGTPLPDFDRLWDYAHPDSTEARFRALEPRARASGDTAYLGELLTQIARTEGLQRRFDAAHRTLDEVETLLHGAPPASARPQTAGPNAARSAAGNGDPFATLRARYLLERGRVYNSSGDPETALPLFEEALDAARAAHADYHAIDAAHMIAIVSPPEEALAWNERAIAMAEETDDPRAAGWLGSLYNNTGWTYHDMGEYAKALVLFKKAVELRREQGDAIALRIARWCVARTLRSLGQVEEALDRQRALDAELAAAGDTDGYVSEEIAECLLALGRGDEARPWFARAHESLASDPWMASNEAERLARLAELGGVTPADDEDEDEADATEPALDEETADSDP